MLPKEQSARELTLGYRDEKITDIPTLMRATMFHTQLSVRARKCLQRLGILTLGELVSRTESELLSSKNFGDTSLQEIKLRLEEHSLALRKFDPV